MKIELDNLAKMNLTWWCRLEDPPAVGWFVRARMRAALLLRQTALRRSQWKRAAPLQRLRRITSTATFPLRALRQRPLLRLTRRTAV